MDAKKLKLACCELVTVNGRPFTIQEDSGLRKIIDPIIDRLNAEKQAIPITINRQNIKEEINEMAYEITFEIKEEVKAKLVCLKTDLVTRLDRSLIGINCQYAHETRFSFLILIMFTLSHFTID